MKLLIESWRRYLKEEEELREVRGGMRLLIKKIKNTVAQNRFLSHLAKDVTKDTIKDAGGFYYLQFPDQLSSDHIKKHFDQGSDASIWNIPEEQVSQLMLQTMRSQKPTKSVKERGALKHKWLNIDTGQQIGFDSLKKLDPNDPSIQRKDDTERFTMTDRVKEWGGCKKNEDTGEMECTGVNGVAIQNNYELVTQEGEPYTEQHLANNVPSFIKQEIGVIPGDKMENPTSLVNLIVAQIGDVNGKPVVSLMSVYPGHQPVGKTGEDLTNKKDFKDHGYYFIQGE